MAAIRRVGSSSALRTISTPIASSPSSLQLLERGEHVEIGDAAAGHDPLLDRGARGVERVLHAVLALLERGLGGRAHLDHRHAAGQLGQALLELLAVIGGVGLLDLALDLREPALDGLRRALALDDGRVVLGHDHLLGAAEHLERPRSPA